MKLNKVVTVILFMTLNLDQHTDSSADVLEDVRIQLVLRSEELNDDEQATEGEGDETVKERSAEADAADGRGAHPAEEDQLPLVVQRRLAHQIVQFS